MSALITRIVRWLLTPPAPDCTCQRRGARYEHRHHVPRRGFDA